MQLNELLNHHQPFFLLVVHSVFALNMLQNRLQQIVVLPCLSFAYLLSKVLKVSMRMIDRVKQRFVEDGFEACLERKPSEQPKERKVDGDLEAHLIALSCSKAPKGFSRWSL